MAVAHATSTPRLGGSGDCKGHARRDGGYKVGGTGARRRRDDPAVVVGLWLLQYATTAVAIAAMAGRSGGSGSAAAVRRCGGNSHGYGARRPQQQGP